jgi:carboxyl-terminal processing protease
MEKKSPQNKYWIPLLVFVFMAIGIWLGYTLSPAKSGVMLTRGEERYTKLKDIVDMLNTRYVDEVNGDKIFEETISDMLHKLDPHSNYLTAEEAKRANEQIQGQFGGIGVRFAVIRDTICVTNVVPNSPSMAAGVKAGDKIIMIENKSVASKKISTDKIMKLLKGPENTGVNLTLLRNNSKIHKSIIRGIIPLGSVSTAYMINNTTGFIKVDEFSIATGKEFQEASDRLKKLGMKKMILDLRNNPGGVLQSAVEIVDEFLPAGKVIVRTKGAHLREQVYKSTSKGDMENIKLVVLINSNSASASEIVAGALQDNDRAMIMGRRSFGKGLVQEDILLSDKSNVRLTIARYYTPTGRCIQKPYSDDYESYLKEEMERFENGEQFKADTSKFADSLKYKTPKGKIVYGGGGIFPDIFISLDTLGSSWYFTDLRYTPSFQNFAFDFVANKRNHWKSMNIFLKDFNIDEKLLRDFVNYAQKYHNVKVDEKGLSISKTLLKQTLKAEIARQLWTEDGYYSVINQYDKEVQRALR